MSNYNEKELLAKAKRPLEVASRLHSYYKGKISVAPKCRIRDLHDFDVWYTPGVAAPCREIEKNPELAYEYTSKWNTVAVISDGTRVLGLGDIGPLAAIPVMEGKALLYKYLGGVDSLPICLNTKDPDVSIETVKLLQTTLRGINLEDISQPKCFYILERLRKECSIPVWHDDQQGTAAVTLAGLYNALKVAGKRLEDVRIIFMGAGAANIRIADVIFQVGANPEICTMYDTKGALDTKRNDIRDNLELYEKWKICRMTNKKGVEHPIGEELKGADVFISLSKPGPGTVKK